MNRTLILLTLLLVPSAAVAQGGPPPVDAVVVNTPLEVTVVGEDWPAVNRNLEGDSERLTPLRVGEH